MLTWRMPEQRMLGRILADRITWFTQRLQMPNGLKAIGYTASDIPALVDGTLPPTPCHEVIAAPGSAEELAALFEDAMVAWVTWFKEQVTKHNTTFQSRHHEDRRTRRAFFDLIGDP